MSRAITARAVLAALLLLPALALAANPRVELTTSQGDIVLELYPKAAPDTVANFLRYVDDGFYEGTVFHRVINGFMIQGGGFDADLKQKDTRAPIRNEADSGLRNERGTIAMARTNDPDSANSQFFIMFASAPHLNGQYTVFGEVTSGMDLVDNIKRGDPDTGGMVSDPDRIVSLKVAADAAN